MYPCVTMWVNVSTDIVLTLHPCLLLLAGWLMLFIIVVSKQCTCCILYCCGGGAMAEVNAPQNLINTKPQSLDANGSTASLPHGYSCCRVSSVFPTCYKIFKSVKKCQRSSSPPTATPGSHAYSAVTGVADAAGGLQLFPFHAAPLEQFDPCCCC